MKTVACALFLLLLGACCTPKEAVSPPGSVDMSVVIDRVKTELNHLQYSDIPVSSVRAGVCSGVSGNALVYIVPTQAELTLRVASTNTVEGSVGAKIPAGQVVTVNPGFSGSYKSVGTHAFTLDLDIQHNPSASEIQSNIDAATKEIDAYGKAQKALAASEQVAAARFAALIQKRTAERLEDYKALATAAADDPRGKAKTPDVRAPDAPGVTKRDIPDLPASLNGYPLAATLWTLREQLLHVDHSLTPCVKPNKLEVDVDFEVQKDAQGKLGIDILIVSIGGTRERIDDVTQHLKITFDMSGSTQLDVANVADQQ